MAYYRFPCQKSPRKHGFFGLSQSPAPGSSDDDAPSLLSREGSAVGARLVGPIAHGGGSRYQTHDNAWGNTQPPPSPRGGRGQPAEAKMACFGLEKVIVRTGMGRDKISGRGLGFPSQNSSTKSQLRVESQFTIIVLFRDGNLHMVHGGRFQVINQKGNALVKIPVWAASFKPCWSNSTAAELEG